MNQVRYNKNNNLIASSGVEKMVKVRTVKRQKFVVCLIFTFVFGQLWSTLPIGAWKGNLHKENADSQRNVYTHDDYIYLVGHSGQVIVKN